MTLEPELTAALTQFGMAGMIAWMWLVERRAAAAREKQLGDAHERLLEQRVQLDALLRVVADNTRAVAAVESGLRAIGAMVESFMGQSAESNQATPSPLGRGWSPDSVGRPGEGHPVPAPAP